MFKHLYTYRLRVLLGNRVLLFWTCVFPLILGLFFNAAFGGLDDIEVLETSEVAIISDDKERAENFTSILEQLTSGDKQLFIPVEMSADEANKKLLDQEISGIYTVSSNDIELKIASQSIRQTIMQSYLNQYLQNEQLVTDIFTSRGAITQADLDALAIQQNYIQEDQDNRTGSEKSFYFFTLIGMACMYGFMWGMRNAKDEQANYSANGIRLSMIPENKLKVIVANIAASFTVFYTEILIVLLVFNFIYDVDFGNRWPQILLLCALGSLNALVFGSFISNRLKINENAQEGVALTITMVLSVLAGMMGTTSLKYYIATHLPLLGIINPVNLIGEGLYKLYYYENIDSFYMNLLYLAIMTVVFTVFGFLFERRAQYDHI